jgi:phosphoribosylformylglycinamidine cyclo-ligase
MIVNDLIVVGADPMVIEAYVASGDSEWFKDEVRAEELNSGWENSTNAIGAVWGGGESPALRDLVEKNSAELAGAAVGKIFPKKRLTLGDKLQSGDRMLAVESSGIHANGLTLAREVADLLPDRYATTLPDGKTYGESLLAPTHLYVNLVRDLFEAEVDIHYMVNVTGLFIRH